MSTLYLALNTDKGSKGGALVAAMNLTIMINQTENAGLQSSNTKSDVNKTPKNEEFVIFIMTVFYLI